MSDLENVLADMRRKYLHAAESGDFLKGEGLGKDILAQWIPVVERMVAENARLRVALEAAPEPPSPSRSMDDVGYVRWYHATRAEALRHE